MKRNIYLFDLVSGLFSGFLCCAMTTNPPPPVANSTSLGTHTPHHSENVRHRQVTIPRSVSSSSLHSLEDDQGSSSSSDDGTEGASLVGAPCSSSSSSSWSARSILISSATSPSQIVLFHKQQLLQKDSPHCWGTALKTSTPSGSPGKKGGSRLCPTCNSQVDDCRDGFCSTVWNKGRAK